MVKIAHAQYLEDRERIIHELERNPLKKIEDIAKELEFSKQKIYKIKREFYSKKKKETAIHFSDNTLRRFLVLARAKQSSFMKDSINVKTDSEINRFLQKFNIHLDFSYISNGNSDLIFGISSKDIVDTKMFCNLLQQEFHDFIECIEIIEILKPFSLNLNNSIKVSNNNNYNY